MEQHLSIRIVNYQKQASGRLGASNLVLPSRTFQRRNRIRSADRLEKFRDCVGYRRSCAAGMVETNIFQGATSALARKNLEREGTGEPGQH
ncbi:unnamed protein product [Gongylonema pulchrum]|uniref:Uncharacterized protein n=1 Tax=Gongylonema pulchrum TaxID=637853 RepID=A0A183DRG2_9BILA|nr:unnamed protein product [Gongylonema pulchrum]